MKSHAKEHSIFRSGINKLSHQRNLTAVESLKFLNPIHVDLPKFNSHFHQNKPISQRFSWFQRKNDSNTQFKTDLVFLKSKINNCEISLGNQQQEKSNLKEKKQEGQKKVPRFIKERQLSKSEQTHKNVSKQSQIESQTLSQVDRSQKLRKAKAAEKSWLVDLEEENSFDIEVGQSFGQPVLQKRRGKNKNQVNQIFSQLSLVQKGNGKEQESFKTTQSTIKTVSRSVSEKNIFLPNLTEWEQQQIQNDFKQLFSSRRVETDTDLDKVDQELAREFQLILN